MTLFIIFFNCHLPWLLHGTVKIIFLSFLNYLNLYTDNLLLNTYFTQFTFIFMIYCIHTDLLKKTWWKCGSLYSQRLYYSLQLKLTNHEKTIWITALQFKKCKHSSVELYNWLGLISPLSMSKWALHEGIWFDVYTYTNC